MKRILPLTVVLGLLLIVHAGLAQPHGAGRPRAEGRPEGCLLCLPDITAEQLQAIQALRADLQTSLVPLREELRAARRELHELMRGSAADAADVRRAKERLDELETRKLMLLLEHREEVRSLLNEEQQIFFDEMRHGSPGPREGRPGRQER